MSALGLRVVTCVASDYLVYLVMLGTGSMPAVDPAFDPAFIDAPILLIAMLLEVA